MWMQIDSGCLDEEAKRKMQKSDQRLWSTLKSRHRGQNRICVRHSWNCRYNNVINSLHILNKPPFITSVSGRENGSVTWAAHLHEHTLIQEGLNYTLYWGNLYCVIIGSLESGLSSTWGGADVANPSWFICLVHNSLGGWSIQKRKRCSHGIKVLWKSEPIAPQRSDVSLKGADCGTFLSYPLRFSCLDSNFNVRRRIRKSVLNLLFSCQLNWQHTPFRTKKQIIFPGQLELFLYVKSLTVDGEYLPWWRFQLD